ncbi:receptor-like protein EIX2 [Lycium ferocissimum]|uniref:receptor-like protein EIX2 n=1 Tax=Lycium ferocissimum TaxID=112874 RepID=UPI002815E558|nr:receptor-like protein EIX2 [Lycium ferocissimum]
MGEEEEKKECCSWKGVQCSNRTGHIMVLDIHTPQPMFNGNEYLRSNIAPSLLELQHLKYLDLSYNVFGRSGIPDFIGPLPNLKTFSALRELRLNNNQFKGILTLSVGQLSKLERLRVNSNFLEGSITESHLSNLSTLKELDLSYNSFSFQLEPNWIAPFE